VQGWSLPSNSGRYEASWSVTGHTTNSITYDFSLVARTYNFGPGGSDDGGHHLLFSFPGLVANKEPLWHFAQGLESWLTLPLPELAKTHLEVEGDFGGRFDEFLLLRFGKDPAIIDEGHPIALFSYSIAGVSGAFSYAADQSCVGSLFAGLSKTLGELAA
jgi:hypothetical protein